MDDDADPQRAGIEDEIADDQAHQKGIGRLHQIAVEQRKQRRRDGEGEAVAESAHRLEDHAAKDTLLHQRRDDAHLSAEQQGRSQTIRHGDVAVRVKPKDGQQVAQQHRSGRADCAGGQCDKDTGNAQRGGKAVQREGNLHGNPAQQNEQEKGNKQTDDRGNQVNQLDDVGGCHDLIAVDADCRTE